MVRKKSKQEGAFLHGTTRMGDRGQIVIPLKIRKALKIQPGEDMVVLAKEEKIIVLPAKRLEQFYSSLLEKLDSLRMKN